MPPGDRSLDVVAATHLDSDHVGGMLGVLDRYRVGTVVHGGDLGETAGVASAMVGCPARPGASDGSSPRGGNAYGWDRM